MARLREDQVTGQVLKVCNRCGDLHEGTGAVCDRCYRPRPRAAYTTREKNTRARRLYKTAAWRKTRELVLERDGHLCQNCGRTAPLSVHHVIPAERAADPLDPGNLITLCRRCHNRADARRRANERSNA
jgi:5-methylcytosine-specific restriction endonuclease McrA